MQLLFVFRSRFCGVEGWPDDLQPWRWPRERVLVTGTRALAVEEKAAIIVPGIGLTGLRDGEQQTMGCTAGSRGLIQRRGRFPHLRRRP